MINVTEPNEAPRVAASARETRAMSDALVDLLPDLRRRAGRLALTPAAAEDLVQDTAVRALQFASRYDPGSNLRGWLYQILFSVFVTGYRRRRREKRGLEVLTVTPSAWTQRCAFLSPDACVGLTPATVLALEGLPIGFQDVVCLVDLGQHSYRETADLLSLPLGTVMRRLHRGRKALAEALGIEKSTRAAA